MRKTMNKRLILEPGMAVLTYGPTGLTEEKAILIHRLVDEFDELMDPDDISRPVEKTVLQRWEVRFVGDSMSTFARWVDPRNVVPIIDKK